MPPRRSVGGLFRFSGKATSTVGIPSPESTAVHNRERKEVLMGSDRIIEVHILHVEMAQILMWRSLSFSSVGACSCAKGHHSSPTGCSDVKVWDPVIPYCKASGRKGAQKRSSGPWIVTKQVYQKYVGELALGHMYKGANDVDVCCAIGQTAFESDHGVSSSCSKISISLSREGVQSETRRTSGC